MSLVSGGCDATTDRKFTLGSKLLIEVSISVSNRIKRSRSAGSKRLFLTSEPIKELNGRSLLMVSTRFLTDLLIASSFVIATTSSVTGCLLKDNEMSLKRRDWRTADIYRYKFSAIFILLMPTLNEVIKTTSSSTW